ncbi:NADPH:quinone reductase [Kibdelosporangium phytohabitans]|uniref:Oxidoreductase n=1 Tax=Kibdelosporangium phytohabitans TaxID=860235 RepID=A0A0N9I9C5_9PSEU|nr:NADPH:quinone reductase [Kibdelosporangium phytohabitans]ALG15050.1 oxidoreductase [Kibdelosporangium phytohabitans]MBE1468893.1 2-desacetyl-2-hydroxyethyl bacteriochlorophyllide A dehydrogenase [Kibdelosporangium phytohabitans]
MHAAYIKHIGPAEDIRFGDVPTPRPGRTDVLVTTIATTVNWVDTFVRSGVFPTPIEFPFVIGRDMVGTVTEVGPHVRGFAPGDTVWCNSLGHGGRQGAAAEHVVVPADRLYHLPPGVNPIDAVAVAHPAATAYLALFTYGQIRAGETVVVAGAAGNVGSALVTLAVNAGARVVATASARDAGYCKALGAADVIDYRDPRRWQHIDEVCPQGIDCYVDSAGENDLAGAVELLALRGRIVVLAGVRAQPVVPVGQLYVKNGSIVGFVISHATVDALAEAARTINKLLSNGRLRPRATVTLPLSAAAEAHRMVEQGELRGKRVILDARVSG